MPCSGLRPEAGSHGESHGKWYGNHRHNQSGCEMTRDVERKVAPLQVLIPHVKWVENQFDPVPHRLAVRLVIHI
jgi:hypothetical protein